MNRFSLLLVAFICSIFGLGLGAAEAPRFADRSLDEFPAGDLQRQLVALGPAPRSAALAALAALPIADASSLMVDAAGLIAYHCARGPTTAMLTQVAAGPRAGAAVAVSPFPASLMRHSRAGASRVIYLSFSGGVVSGRSWNAGTPTQGSVGTPFVLPIQPSWDCLPYDRDSDAATFSAAEQADIIDIWSRVAEDYAPFDVDVTTEAPAIFTITTAWVLITGEKDRANNNTPNVGIGGVASIGSFGLTDYAFKSPAWVWSGDATSTPASHIADAATHEVGHNLGLSHDGKASVTGDNYHRGLNATPSAPSWGPIMGAPYDRDLTLWSKGDYFDANQTQDDLAIIGTRLGLRPDTHGHTTVTASTLAIAANGTFAQTGVVARSNVPDVFRFTWPGGDFAATVAPFRAATGTAGGNLDLSLELRSGDDATQLAFANDPVALGAAVASTGLVAGDYLLVIRPVGAGTPLANPPSGYTSYGVLGAYLLSGSAGPTLTVLDASAALCGTVQIGQSTTRTVTVFNSGSSGTVTITAWTGAVAAPFALGNVPSPLPTLTAGASASCTVTFTPTASGSFSDVLTIDGGATGSVTVTLSGTGIPPLPPAVVVPPPAPAAKSSGSDKGGGGLCGAGSGIAVILMLLALRLRFSHQRLARPVR